MPTLHDDEFGEITIRRSKLARSVKLSLAPSGSLRISMPPYAPLFLAKRLINSSRASLRELQASHRHSDLHNGMRIGKSHHILIKEGNALKVQLHEQSIIIWLPPALSLESPLVTTQAVPIIIKALRREAKSYLPRRLAYLADEHGFHYESVRFSHASTRWGSCSSNGTISLNIALMRLDFNLIDYVLVHELSHTKQMNHSQAFWELVEHSDPEYKLHRRLLKAEQPHPF
jgi:predicted metal-dependent hydrolase